MGFVYLVTNLVNGKKYVGKTLNKYLSNRWSGHTHAARNGSPYYFHKAIRTYGIESFVIHPIASFDEPTLNVAEQLFISEFGTRAPHGYNLTDGGEGVSGLKRTPEQCRRMSEALKGKRLSETHKENIRLGAAGKNKGKVRTSEVRQRMSETRKGVPLGPRKNHIPSMSAGARYTRAYRERQKETI